MQLLGTFKGRAAEDVFEFSQNLFRAQVKGLEGGGLVSGWVRHIPNTTDSLSQLIADEHRAGERFANRPGLPGPGRDRIRSEG